MGQKTEFLIPNQENENPLDDFIGAISQIQEEHLFSGNVVPCEFSLIFLEKLNEWLVESGDIKILPIVFQPLFSKCLYVVSCLLSLTPDFQDKELSPLEMYELFQDQDETDKLLLTAFCYGGLSPYSYAYVLLYWFGLVLSLFDFIYLKQGDKKTFDLDFIGLAYNFWDNNFISDLNNESRTYDNIKFLGLDKCLMPLDWVYSAYICCELSDLLIENPNKIIDLTKVVRFN